MDYGLRFNDLKLEKDRMVFYDNSLQALCEWDLMLNRVSMIALNEGKHFEAFKLFDVGDAIFFTSLVNSDLLKYDKEKAAFDIITCELIGKPGEVTALLSQQFMLNGKIYMLLQQAADYPLISFDIMSQTYEANDLLRRSFRNRSVRFPFGSVRDDEFWAADYSSNIYYGINPIAGEIKTYVLKEAYQLHSICRIDGTWIASTVDSEIIAIDDDGTVEVLHEGRNVSQGYSFIVDLKEYVVALPRYGDEVFLYNKKEKISHSVILKLEDIKDLGGSASKCISCCEHDDAILVLPYRMMKMLAIDKRNLVVSGCNPSYDENIYRKWLENNILQESELLDLSEYICAICAKGKTDD